MRLWIQHRLSRAWAPLAALLRQGVSPAKLALGVSLGVVCGLVPVLGASTLLCTALALALRLNLPAIQLVNYLVTPLQLLLIIPQLRLGEWLTRSPAFPVTLESGMALLSQGPIHAITVLGTAIVHATIAWLVLAPLAAVLLFHALAAVFRRFTTTMIEVTP
jgi:uncharacterized protein (DUF2062 family)